MTKLLTVAEVASILRVNPAFVYRLHNAGLLKLIKVGSLKCRPETLEDFLATFDGYDVSDPEKVVAL